jgi:hypothetical protein
MNLIGLLLLVTAIYLGFSLLKKKDAAKVGTTNLDKNPKKLYRVLIEIILIFMFAWIFLRFFY